MSGPSDSLDLRSMLSGLLELEEAGAFKPDIGYVRSVELSPALVDRIKAACAAPKPGDRVPVFGSINFSTNALLPDGTGHIRFADGKWGIWDLATGKVAVFQPLGGVDSWIYHAPT